MAFHIESMILMDVCPPILFLIFNRPDCTRKAFEQIRKARPAALYVAGDGPRAGREEDVRLCEEARSIIDSVDWSCNIQTLFQAISNSPSSRGVVATRHKGINECVIDRHTGILVEERDINGMAELLQDESKWSLYSEAGISHIQDKYSSKQEEQSLLQIVEDACSKRQRREATRENLEAH